MNLHDAVFSHMLNEHRGMRSHAHNLPKLEIRLRLQEGDALESSYSIVEASANSEPYIQCWRDKSSTARNDELLRRLLREQEQEISILKQLLGRTSPLTP